MKGDQDLLRLKRLLESLDVGETVGGGGVRTRCRVNQGQIGGHGAESLWIVSNESIYRLTAGADPLHGAVHVQANGMESGAAQDRSQKVANKRVFDYNDKAGPGFWAHLKVHDRPGEHVQALYQCALEDRHRQSPQMREVGVGNAGNEAMENE